MRHDKIITEEILVLCQGLGLCRIDPVVVIESRFSRIIRMLIVSHTDAANA